MWHIHVFYHEPLSDIDGDGLVSDNLIIDDRFSDIGHFIIRSAAARWEHYSSLDFREDDQTTDENLTVHALRYSPSVGGYADPPSDVLLDPNYFEERSSTEGGQVHVHAVAMHELGHIIGFQHIFDGTVSVMDYRFDDPDPSEFDIRWTGIHYQPAPVQSLTGSAADEVLLGGAGADKLSGAAGADVLVGSQDADRLYGGSGDDLIYGNQDQDMLIGEAGNDTLFGGQASDTLSGGAGDDVLAGGRGADLFLSGTGSNRIADFSPGDGDRIAGSMTSASDATDGAVIQLDGGGTVMLIGVSVATVQSDWFLDWML